MSVIGEQRVVDRFDGDILDERWVTFNGSGLSTFEITDAIDGGFRISTAGSNNANGEISYSSIRQFDAEKFEQVSIWLRIAGGEGQVGFGLTDEPNGILGSSVNNQFNIVDTFGTAFKSLSHNNGIAPGSNTDLAAATDTIAHKYKLNVNLARGTAFVDGILNVSVTTDLPSGPVQPALFVRRFSVGGVQEGRISFQEVYNL